MTKIEKAASAVGIILAVPLIVG